MFHDHLDYLWKLPLGGRPNTNRKTRDSDRSRPLIHITLSCVRIHMNRHPLRPNPHWRKLAWKAMSWMNSIGSLVHVNQCYSSNSLQFMQVSSRVGWAWDSIWLEAESHMTSHYTWGPLTTLNDFGGVLGTAFGHFLLGSHNSWSWLLARVWSGL